MQNSPSQVRSGNISPTISGPHKDKDVLVVSGLVVSLAAAIGAFWYFSSTDPRVGDQLDSSAVTEMLKAWLLGLLVAFFAMMFGFLPAVLWVAPIYAWLGRSG